MSHPALNRILRQISKNREELTLISESSEPMPPESSGAVEGKVPLEEVVSLFSDDNLKERKEELDKLDPSLEQEKLPPALAQEKLSPALAQEKLPPDLPQEEMAPPLRLNPNFSEEQVAEEIAEEKLFPDHTPLDQLPPDVQEYLKEEKESYEFRSVFDLRDFILQQQDFFDEYQKGALNSVVAAANAINAGCKCKRNEMLQKIEDYYANFIKNNKNTSLITKMKEVLNAKKLIFSSNGVVFLTI